VAFAGASNAITGLPVTPVVTLAREGCADAGAQLTARMALDALHFLSAGAVGFARGLNDAPKIGALAATLKLMSGSSAASLVAVSMAVGGLVGSRRVAVKMSHGITTLSAGQAFAANLVTATLVASASWVALPVSTTHVSVGALLGIGASGGKTHGSTILSILLAWVITVPVALSIAWCVATALR
jgi:PiT family inorganic phosphate transporter